MMHGQKNIKLDWNIEKYVYINEEFVLMEQYKNDCIDENDVMLNCHYCKEFCYLQLLSRLI